MKKPYTALQRAVYGVALSAMLLHRRGSSVVMIEIREASEEDQAGIAQVVAEATATLRRVYRPNAGALANRAAMKRSLVCLVAEMDGVIAGTVEYAIEDHVLRVINLGVRESFRRAGIARALVEALAAIARSSGVPSLRVHTVKETGNVPIFERMGFRVTAESEDTYSEGDGGTPLTDVQLRRDVDESGSNHEQAEH